MNIANVVLMPHARARGINLTPCARGSKAVPALKCHAVSLFPLQLKRVDPCLFRLLQNLHKHLPKEVPVTSESGVHGAY